jgi:1,2-diacylglycerol 3-alpha-glucosyltransferase
MKILMLTNTYAPHVGGVARSVEAFTTAYRARGHEVLVVCPEFENAPEDEPGVVRIPAIQRFNGSDFSVVLRTPRWLRRKVEAFRPDLIHSHHPFLLGATAVRLARMLDVPLVFTHHTMYEHYTHYVPGNSPAMQRFAIHLSSNYANLSDAVFAPSQAVASILRRRGVRVPIQVVPTGVRLKEFATGSGAGFRAIMGIPHNAFLVGYVGRLAPEKNLGFLARALERFLGEVSSAHAIIAGAGPSLESLRRALGHLGTHVHFAGVLHGPFLTSAYKAMDAFAFASLSETQGMVLLEAMAAGVPVVALAAPGADEVVRDGENGRLLADGDETAFADALRAIADQPRAARKALSRQARATAEVYSLTRTAETALAAYDGLLTLSRPPKGDAQEAWQRTIRMLRSEWDLLAGMADAALARDDNPDLAHAP